MNAPGAASRGGRDKPVQTRTDKDPGQPEITERASARPSRDAAPPAAGRPAVLNIRTLQEKGLTWVDIQRPGRPEMEWLRAHYHFHPLHLEDVVSKIQRPKLDERED